MRNNRAGSLSHSTMTTCCLPIVRSQLVSQEDNKKQGKDMTYCIHLTWKLLKSILQCVYFQWQSHKLCRCNHLPLWVSHALGSPSVFLCILISPVLIILNVEHLLLHFIHLIELRRHTRYCARSNRGMRHSLWPQSMPVYWRDGHITRSFKSSVLSKVLEV